MSGLRIYVDFMMPAEAAAVLREGAAMGGHELIFPGKPAASVLARAETDDQILQADVAFGQPDTIAVSEAPNLKWVHISSSGITRYDNPEFRSMMARRGIPLSNSAGVYNEACAVHALSFMLAQARHLPVALQTRTPNGSDTWNAIRSGSGTLRGQTVVILGYGAIGQRLAELLQPFGMEVLAFRRKRRGDEVAQVIDESQLPGVLARRADHVMNILPDSAETRGFFSAARFAGMKPGAVFYNIGRGSTVDQAALVDALASGRLAAAWLDVTDPEPLPEGHPLLRAPRCYITPHTAGGHAGEHTTLVRHFLGNLERFTRGEPLKDRVM